MRFASLFVATALVVVAVMFAPGCSASAPPDQAVHAQSPTVDLRALDWPAPSIVDQGAVLVTVRACYDGEPAHPTPWAKFSTSGAVLFARGPCEYRNPAFGRWEKLPPGAEIAFTDGPVEVEVDAPDEGGCPPETTF